MNTVTVNMKTVDTLIWLVKLSCDQSDKEIPTVPCFIFPLKWFLEKVHLANILCQISYRVPFVAHFVQGYAD